MRTKIWTWVGKSPNCGQNLDHHPSRSGKSPQLRTKFGHHPSGGKKCAICAGNLDIIHQGVSGKSAQLRTKFGHHPRPREKVRNCAQNRVLWAGKKCAIAHKISTSSIKAREKVRFCAQNLDIIHQAREKVRNCAQNLDIIHLGGGLLGHMGKKCAIAHPVSTSIQTQNPSTRRPYRNRQHPGVPSPATYLLRLGH